MLFPNNAPPDRLRQLIDLAHDQSRTLVHEHSPEALGAFVRTAEEIEQLGYKLTWHKRRNIIQCTRREAQ